MTDNYLLYQIPPSSNPESAIGFSHSQLFFRPPSDLHGPFPCHRCIEFLPFHLFVPLNANVGPHEAFTFCLMQEALAIGKLGVLPRCNVHTRRGHSCEECRNAPEQSGV
jgi:hypothetical protein